MERRAIIAILLIFIVLMWYNLMIAPRYQGKPQMVPEQEPRVADTTSFEKPHALPPCFDSTSTEKQVIVTSPIYTAILSSRGAVLTCLKLNNYMGVDDLPVDLVQANAEFGLPLATILYLKNGEQLDISGYVFATHKDSVVVNAGEAVEVRFDIEITPGDRVTKTYVFSGDSYHIFAKVNMTERIARGVRAVETGWYSGLPSTEQNRGDDLRNFACISEGSEGLTKFDLGKIRKHRKIPVAGDVRWVASRTKYFLAAIDVDRQAGAVGKAFVVGDDRIGISVEVDLKEKSEVTFGVYAGPLDYHRLKQLGVGVEKAVDFGWRWILPLSKLIFAFMVWMYRIIPNYGVVIILLSGLTKLIFHPLTQKSMKSMREMQLLQPEINALREKYKNEPEKLNRALLQLYKERGINPLGGCLPLLLQMPVFISLFNVLSRTIELRRAPFVLWIRDLSTPDVIAHLPFSLPFIGNAISLLPILMGIAMFIQQKMTTTDPKQAVMTYAMPIIFTVMFFKFPSGLVLYWLVNNVITIGHQYLMTRGQKTVGKSTTGG